MLAVALALAQAHPLLPPTPAAPAPDEGYAARVRDFARHAEWPWPEIGAHAPQTPAQQAALARMLDRGDVREARLCAVLASGAPAGDFLGHALLAAALRHPREEESLACLLAVTGFEDAHLAALAWLALDEERTLAVRAAAVGRLLEADCSSAWPLARSVLRTGTALDERAPWADWVRSGRYELPKRLLLLSVRRWLRAHGDRTTDFEPNASWPAQERSLAALEETVTPWWRAAQEGPAKPPASWRWLLARAGAGDRRAARALALLHTRTRDFLLAAMRGEDRRTRLGARWSLQRLLR